MDEFKKRRAQFIRNLPPLDTSYRAPRTPPDPEPRQGRVDPGRRCIA
jgi:hypothetical protein